MNPARLSMLWQLFPGNRILLFSAFVTTLPSRTQGLFFFFFTFYFILGYSQINNVIKVSGGQQRDSAIHTWFSPNLPSHPGCHKALSTVPCAIYSKKNPRISTPGPNLWDPGPTITYNQLPELLELLYFAECSSLFSTADRFDFFKKGGG